MSYIHHSRDDRSLDVMFRTGIAVSFGEYLEAFGVADPMFDPDPKTAEAMVVFLFLLGQFAGLRLFIRMIEITVVIAISLIAAISVEVRSAW